MAGKVIGMIYPNGSRNVELIFSILRLVTGKLTAVEKILSKLKMNLSDVVSQFKPSTFVELQLTELIFIYDKWRVIQTDIVGRICAGYGINVIFKTRIVWFPLP